nr:PREDICTED: envoplakin [Latimeria chalumnae]|eukprot:XP_005993282.1 PREDICTED: envoplakin [Latimeria chalumnae]
MFKSIKSPTKMSRTQTNDLPLLISRMQKNADHVEKEILDTQNKLTTDRKYRKENKPFMYQKRSAENLQSVESLLNGLFLDVDKVKKKNHPQAAEIEKDIHQLHDRWVKECAEYRDTYEQLKIPDIQPKHNTEWLKVIEQKQRQINEGKYGPGLPDLEKQLAEHNILEKEIEEYGSQIDRCAAENPEEFAPIQKQYKNLLDSSKKRDYYLESGYEYLQNCSKELVFLSDEQDKIIKRDWSDRMTNPQEVRRNYQNFKDNLLLPKESSVNKIQDDGDRLIEMKHPASPTILVHRDAVKNEWQSFLNLCICQEHHLKNVDDYKKFHDEANTISQSVKKLNSDLDTKYNKDKNDPLVMYDLLYQIENDEKTVLQHEKNIANLKRQSNRIAPLKLRRTHPSKPITVDALCDMDTGEADISIGEKCTLLDNSDENWLVQSNKGVKKSIPGACFTIPPPDPESIDLINKLTKDFNNVKQKQKDIQATLQSQHDEQNHLRPVSVGYVSSALNVNDKDDPKAKQLLNKLDNVNEDLVHTEKDLVTQVKSPVSRSSAPQDLRTKLSQQEDTAKRLRSIGTEKDAMQSECETFLSKRPTGPSASQLPVKLNNLKNNYHDVNTLSELYKDKIKAALDLENQIKKTDDVLTGFESKLVKDSSIPASANTFQEQVRELQNMKKELNNQQSNLKQLNQDLKVTDQCCRDLQTNFHQYCPDIQKQKAEVQRLNDRNNDINNQLKQREMMLQDADTTYQRFKSSNQALNSWMNNLPDNKIKANDGLEQIDAKLHSQKRVVDEIKRKESEKDTAVSLSRELQSTLNDYELVNEKYQSSLDPALKASPAKKLHNTPLKETIETQEKELIQRYTEVAAENQQQLSQLEFAKNVMGKQGEQVRQLVVQQPLQNANLLQSQKKSDFLKEELEDEKKKLLETQRILEQERKTLLNLRKQRPVEKVEDKEVVQYYRDPKRESEVSSLKSQVEDEIRRKVSTQSDIEKMNKKILLLETEKKSKTPELLSKEFTKIEKDPSLDKEASDLRLKTDRVKEESSTLHNRVLELKNEITILEQKKPKIKEKVVVNEVIKFEKDPEMLRATKSIRSQIDEESLKRKKLDEEIYVLKRKCEEIKMQIGRVEPKVVVKEVKKVEQDPELIRKSSDLRLLLEEERKKNSVLLNELTELQRNYTIIEKQKPKIEVKEIVNELFRIDPETERETVKLRRELQNFTNKKAALDRKINVCLTEINTLKSQEPTIEYKEVTQEVVKLEKSPEILREIERLNKQLKQLEDNYNRSKEQLVRLRNERDEWKREKSKVETQIVNKEIMKYESDPLLEKEADRLRKNVREESQKRRSVEESVYELQNKYILLERKRPEQRVVIEEVVRLQKDPKLMMEHKRLNKELDEETKKRRLLQGEVQQLRALVEEKERSLNSQEEHNKKLETENELHSIRRRIQEIEESPPPIEEKIETNEVMKVEKNPVLEKATAGQRMELEKERYNISNLERERRSLQSKIEVLQRDKSKEKTIIKEVIREEEDQALESKRAHVRDLLAKERNARLNTEEEIQRLTDRINRIEEVGRRLSHEEAELQKKKTMSLQEKNSLERELKDLEKEKEQKTLYLREESKRCSERNEIERQKTLEHQNLLSTLENDILEEKDLIYGKENTIKDLQSKINKELSQKEMQTRETNLSTKISILDPETGKEMSPFEAYRRGFIDKKQYIELQEQECDWEKRTVSGISGEKSILCDKKSGKQYSIEDAIKDGKITKEEYRLFNEGEILISEFALLVTGEPRSVFTQLESTPLSPTRQQNVFSQYHSFTSNEYFPIAGVYDTATDTKISIQNAVKRNMIDSITAQKLFEAQAATGGIIDVGTKERYSVHKAAEIGLIEHTHMQRLLNAQKAFTGVEDPVTKERLSVGEATQKGWILHDNAIRYLEAQYLTGGLVDPKKTGRVKITDAVQTKMIDSNTARILQEEYNYVKDLIHPISKEKIHYKEAMARCIKDDYTGLLLLPATSGDRQIPLYRPVNGVHAGVFDSRFF